MIQSIDTALFFLINRGSANPPFDILMPLLSERGYLLAFPVFALVLLPAFRHVPGERYRALLSAARVCITPIVLFFLADWINELLKNAFARPRPCHALEGVTLLVHCPRSFSLPSGHAIDSFAFATSFFLLSRPVVSAAWRWYVLLLAAAIAFSRVYIGVHYPSDVIVGTLLGMAIAWVACALLLKGIGNRSSSIT